MKIKKMHCCISLFLLSLQFLFCSLPSDVEPVNWKMHVEVPVKNEQYGIRELIEREYDGDIDIQLGTEDSIGDTLYFSQNGSFTYTINREIIETEPSVSERTVGVITLENTPQVDMILEFFDANDLPGSGIIPSDVNFNTEKDTVLDGIKWTTIDETSPKLDVSVINKSQATIQDLKVYLINSGKSVIDSFHTDLLAARDTIIAPYNFRNKTIHNEISVRVTGLLPSGSQVSANDGLNVAFNLDNQKSSGAEIIDSLIKYDDNFRDLFSLVDSMNLNYIDIDSALLRFEINNPCAFKVEVIGAVENAWDCSFAKTKNIKFAEQLGSITDSSYYMGNVIFDTAFSEVGTETYIKTISLNSLRLFPTWNPDSAKSVLNFSYSLKAISDGRWVTFDKNDVITFKIIPEQFPFVQVGGVFTEPKTETFLSEEEIGFGWDDAILDSLKKSFRFENAPMNLQFAYDMPKSSHVDSVLVYLELADKNVLDSPVVLNETFCGIKTDTQHVASVQLRSLLDRWPDVITYKSRVLFPVGTGFELINEKDVFGNYKSNLEITVNMNWQMKIALAWNVLDTINVELEQSQFSLGKDFDWVNKIVDPRITMKINAVNNSNLQFKLFGLCASEKDTGLLNSAPESAIYSYTPGVDNGRLFRLFGLYGLNLPPRGHADSVSVELDSIGVNALFNNGKCHIRWFLVIPKVASDVLLDTDFFDINATAVVEGICHTDSLLY